MSQYNPSRFIPSTSYAELTNLIRNGNFSNGIVDWSVIGASVVSSTGNELVISTSAQNNRVQQSIPFNTGDTIYRCAYVKTDSVLVGIGTTAVLLKAHSGSGLYERLSDARVFGNNFMSVIDTRTSGFSNISIKNMLVINLTAVFGAGNEPRLEVIDTMLLGYASNGWFDGRANKLDGMEYLIDARAKSRSSGANVKAMAHRGYSVTAPENTLPSFLLAKQKGFAYVETDIRFTSDDVPVLLHLDTVNSTSNGTGAIASMTLAQAKALDFGSWKSAVYAGTKIPTFEEFIYACKNLNLHPYIEIKLATNAQILIAYNICKYAGMKRNVTWIGSITYLTYMLTLDAKARVGVVTSTLDSTVISNVAALKTADNDVFADAEYSVVTKALVNECIDANIGIECWTVETSDAARQMSMYGVAGITTSTLILPNVLSTPYFFN